MDHRSIIILGATPTSEAFIAMLNRYGNQITLIDQDMNNLKRIGVKYDINTICEFPSYPETLQLADTINASALIAITPSDETNLIACHVAKHQAPEITCITSLSTHGYSWGESRPSYAQPVNSALSCPLSIYEDIHKLLENPGYLHINQLGAEFYSASLKIDKGTPLIGMTLEEANQTLPKKMIMAGLRRQNAWVKFRRNIKIAEKDIILLVSSEKQLSNKRFSKQSPKNLILLGISDLTKQLCLNLPHYQITVIEPSRELCHSFSMAFPNITTINDDPLDKRLLDSLGTAQATVIACSNDDENNLVYSYQAKDTNSFKVFTLLNNLREGHIFEKGPIDYTINAPQVVCDEIIRDLLKARNVLNFYTKQNYLQIASLLVSPSHPYCNKVISDITLPEETFIGCIIRDHEALFTDKNTTVLDQDIIILYSNHTKQSYNPLEAMFLPPDYLFNGKT